MSGDHNMNQKFPNSNVCYTDTVSKHELECMRQTAESYKELMDAHAKELDRAMELLRRAENEMRYAGWTKYESDNSARNGVYEQIERFLK
jgi:coproporphyrinogen III oxidase-like Fe-S oxidoreductase